MMTVGRHVLSVLALVLCCASLCVSAAATQTEASVEKSVPTTLLVKAEAFKNSLRPETEARIADVEKFFPSKLQSVKTLSEQTAAKEKDVTVSATTAWAAKDTALEAAGEAEKVVIEAKRIVMEARQAARTPSMAKKFLEENKEKAENVIRSAQMAATDAKSKAAAASAAATSAWEAVKATEQAVNKVANDEALLTTDTKSNETLMLAVFIVLRKIEGPVKAAVDAEEAAANATLAAEEAEQQASAAETAANDVRTGIDRLTSIVQRVYESVEQGKAEKLKSKTLEEGTVSRTDNADSLDAPPENEAGTAGEAAASAGGSLASASASDKDNGKTIANLYVGDSSAPAWAQAPSLLLKLLAALFCTAVW
ncbi:hypothetical protein DQ04_08131020 [Trypanosoma grayi]|uniref:hypothetical protein n=1 Tax=Trypanosoma grayi TaxID=71804 RepID=UPI0004F41D7C|nr:hypothetical protein DQ04_08131020 [Trypanosoma grayi]KEG08051.1 hypothetical protein DQ04_08131020 [Trypanosoma grayi]